MRARFALTVLSVGMLICPAGAAHAAVKISTQPTQNMSCSAGVCTPTAKLAFLNVTDLTNMLATGDVTVLTGSGGLDIHVEAPFSWTSTSRLTLDAQRSIEFKQPVTVAGTGALTLTTNEGGTGGDYWFDEGASVTFWDTNSSLIINGGAFTLVNSIHELAAAIGAHKFGHFALANSYDASTDGTYKSSPIRNKFPGSFEGLGNTISLLSIGTGKKGRAVGLFRWTDSAGEISGIVLSEAHVEARRAEVGLLVGHNMGSIKHVSVGGKISGRIDSSIGGLAGDNDGLVLDSTANVQVHCPTDCAYAGGLVGFNNGTIQRSFATGGVGGDSSPSAVGGVVGANFGSIADSYSQGAVSAAPNDNAAVGGLVGLCGAGAISHTYALGPITGGNLRGGLIGEDSAGGFSSSYWDLDTSGVSNGCGTGNCVGVTGLTDAQLKSALPEGFDPQVWGQNPNINRGYPYLLANPPPDNAPAKRAAKARRSG